MLPDMMAKPCGACDPDSMTGCIDGCRTPPQIGVVMQYPTGCPIVCPAMTFPATGRSLILLKSDFVLTERFNTSAGQ